MPSPAHVAEISFLFKRRFLPGTPVYVLPTPSNYVADAARMAGMNVVFRHSDQWPFPDLINRLSGKASPHVELVGREEIARHDDIRDDLANGIRAAPGQGDAITEVALVAIATLLRADADIVARAPHSPGAASHAFFEIKTGSGDIRPNQQYVYALTLLGEHVRTSDMRVISLGLAPDLPLPPMDFVFVGAQPPDWKYEFGLVLAAQVDQLGSIARVMAHINGIETLR